MLGLFVITFVLYLTAALLDRRRLRDAERYVTMVGFMFLVPATLAQHLPPLILLLLSLFFAAYLHKAW